MKKLLLSLGTVAAIAAPVASVIACGQTKGAQTGAATTTQVSTLKTLPASDSSMDGKSANELAKLYGIQLDGLQNADGDELSGSDKIQGVTYDDTAGTLEFDHMGDQFTVHLTPKA